ncbi:MAG TPA: hypothetical protein VN668_06215 [Stellaceae bacterium]|nr:hypothetical protein [Stellaceae bacterium]
MPTQEQVPSFRSIAEAGELTGEVRRVATAVARDLDQGGKYEPPAEALPQGVSLCGALDFRIHVSMRYHASRRAWYDRLHRMMMLTIAAGASAAFAAILGGLLEGAEYLCAAVGVAGVLELAYALPEQARIEDALYRRFNALAAEIAEAAAISVAELHRWEARRLLIGADADDRKEVLRRICHNLEAEARGYPPEVRYRVWPWQRLLAQITSLPPLRPLRPDA